MASEAFSSSGLMSTVRRHSRIPHFSVVGVVIIKWQTYLGFTKHYVRIRRWVLENLWLAYHKQNVLRLSDCHTSDARVRFQAEFHHGFPSLLLASALFSLARLWRRRSSVCGLVVAIAAVSPGILVVVALRTHVYAWKGLFAWDSSVCLPSATSIFSASSTSGSPVLFLGL